MITLLDSLVEEIAEIAETGSEAPGARSKAAPAAAPVRAGRAARTAAPAASPPSRPAPAKAAAPRSSASSSPRATTAARRVLPLSGRNQPLIPAQDWDWTVAAPGQIASQQFLLADNLPQSVAAGTEYAASSGSFSENYRLFLDMINADTFPAAAQLTKARRLVAEPTDLPSGGTAPRGWVRVDRSGVLRWAPNWITSDSCQRWTTRANASPSQPQTITIPLKNRQVAGNLIAEGGQASAQTGAATLLSAFSTLSVTAAAWGKITFTPGDWFVSSMLLLGQNYISKPATFFGPKGLLRGRVSAFYVGLDVSITISGQTALSDAKKQSISSDPNLKIMGVEVALDATASSLDSTKPTVTYKQTQTTPQIVAVEIETYAMSQGTDP